MTDKEVTQSEQSEVLLATLHGKRQGCGVESCCRDGGDRDRVRGSEFLRYDGKTFASTPHESERLEEEEDQEERKAQQHDESCTLFVDSIHHVRVASLERGLGW